LIKATVTTTRPRCRKTRFLIFLSRDVVVFDGLPAALSSFSVHFRAPFFFPVAMAPPTARNEGTVPSVFRTTSAMSLWAQPATWSPQTTPRAKALKRANDPTTILAACREWGQKSPTERRA